MRSADDLSRILHRIDGRGYKAYRDIRGSFDLGELTLIIDHVQGDPYATPSKLRVRIPQSLPRELFSTRPRRIALEDHLARRAAPGGNATMRCPGTYAVSQPTPRNCDPSGGRTKQIA